MFNLLDKMFIKRFCLTEKSDIYLYENGSINMNTTCVCGNYNHIACVFKGKLKVQHKNPKVLSFGINQMSDLKGKKPGIHAEQDAINKLKILNNKKYELINLLVIRLSTKNNLQLSKPCAHCIKGMKYLPKKGYKIQYIYYSDGKGNIVKTSLNNLDNEEKHYSRYYKQQNKCLQTNSIIS
jgi:hypothetical protein